MEEGRRRVIIEGVTPEIDCGHFAIKRAVGEKVRVEADIFADGHDSVSCVLCYRREHDSEWAEVPMTPLGNDRWRGEFPVTELGRYCYSLVAWVDHFKTWSRDLAKRVDAGQDVSVDLEIGARLVEAAAQRTEGPDGERLTAYVAEIRGPDGAERALSQDLAWLMSRYAERSYATHYEKELPVTVDPPKAKFSTWYELFPRSTSPVPGQHGTLRDVERLLPDIARMGFDVLYLPPIHPIGRTFRKGKNNSVTAQPGEPGSPWAIGAEEGGHTAIHPELGTLDDFHSLIRAAERHGLQIAMDIAFQASPDHPWAHAHRSWFRERPDGTIQYAENPPKKYQDIYPFDFESRDWQGMWQELAGVFRYWCRQGVRIFRVDNPHTKAFPFWEWCIAEIKREYPDAIFLSEAFTRPRVMYRLAKLGFTQSYTYFTWRNTPEELEEYFTELTTTEVKDYFRPNLWPNTPDILPEYLQHGSRPAFIARLMLAATLGANYGMYGPAYELLEHEPVAPGREEYLNSEKYEIKQWNLEQPDSLREIITLVNRVRRDNPALQSDRNLRFHPVDNDRLIAYSKNTDDGSNIVLTIVNTDPHHVQAGWVDFQIHELDIDPQHPYQVHDLIGGGRYHWHGWRNFVQIDPRAMPGHIFAVRRRVRREHDFDYFM